MIADSTVSLAQGQLLWRIVLALISELCRLLFMYIYMLVSAQLPTALHLAG